MKKSFHILIINDDFNLNIRIVKFLREHHFKIKVTKSIEEAIEKLIKKKKKYNLILLDLDIPHENVSPINKEGRNFDALEIIRSISNVPVIILTSEKHANLFNHLFNLGVDDYLIKPFEMLELLWKIKSRLDIFLNKEMLNDSKAKYKNLFNSINEGIFSADTNLIIQVYNSAAWKILNINSEELKGVSLIDERFHYITEDYNDFNMEKFPAVLSLKNKSSYFDVILGLNFNYNLYWLSINTVPLIDEETLEITGVVASFKDITKLKEVEEQLQDKERHLSETQGIAHIGNWTMDLATFKVQWSDEVYRIFNVDKHIENNVSLDFFFDNAHPEDVEKVEREFELLILENKLEMKAGVGHKPKGTMSFEYKILLPDGNIRMLRVDGEVIKSKKGISKKINGKIQDITEKHKSEEELQLSRLKSNAILENMSDAVVITDDEGFIVNFYPGAYDIFGYTEEDLLNKNFAILTHQLTDENNPEIQLDGIMKKNINDDSVINHANGQYMKSLLNHPKSDIHQFNREFSAQKKDGTIFPAEIFLNEWKLKSKKYFTAIVHDISERKKTEEILRQSARMESLGHLTGGIAHDFNNLLGIISGNLELMQRYAPQDIKLIKRIYTAQKASKRAADLTKKLLTFSRNEPSVNRSVNLNELLYEMFDILQGTIGKNIEIEYKLENGLWIIELNKNEVENTILNLCINAKDAMPVGGTIIIETKNIEIDSIFTGFIGESLPGKYIQVSVKDTGIGIPQNILKNIFDPFFTTKSVERGTGLGLSIVYGFVKSSGGNISVQSTIGVGTSISLYFPYVANEMIDEVILPEKETVGGNEKILVLDDEEDLADIAKEILSLAGYKVKIFYRPDAVLDYLERGGDANLLFSDIVMPGGIDGIIFAEMIRIKWPIIKILLTSGYPQRVSAGKDIQNLNFNLIKKPYAKDQLLLSVRKLLDAPD